MSYYNALLLSYILILTFGYFVTFLLYYIFGWYYDKRLRLVMKRIHLSRFQSFFLRFRGVQIFSFVYVHGDNRLDGYGFCDKL